MHKGGHPVGSYRELTKEEKELKERVEKEDEAVSEKIKALFPGMKVIQFTRAHSYQYKDGMLKIGHEGNTVVVYNYNLLTKELKYNYGSKYIFNSGKMEPQIKKILDEAFQNFSIGGRRRSQKTRKMKKSKRRHRHTRRH